MKHSNINSLPWESLAIEKGSGTVLTVALQDHVVREPLGKNNFGRDVLILGKVDIEEKDEKERHLVKVGPHGGCIKGAVG